MCNRSWGKDRHRDDGRLTKGVYRYLLTPSGSSGKEGKDWKTFTKRGKKGSYEREKENGSEIPMCFPLAKPRAVHDNSKVITSLSNVDSRYCYFSCDSREEVVLFTEEQGTGELLAAH